MTSEYVTGTKRGDQLFRLVRKTETGGARLLRDSIKYVLGAFGTEQYFNAREAGVVQKVEGLQKLHGLITEKIGKAADMVEITRLRESLKQVGTDFGREWGRYSELHFSDTEAMRVLQFGFTIPLIASRVFGRPVLRTKAEEYRANGQKLMGWVTEAVDAVWFGGRVALAWAAPAIAQKLWYEKSPTVTSGEEMAMWAGIIFGVMAPAIQLAFKGRQDYKSR